MNNFWEEDSVEEPSQGNFWETDSVEDDPVDGPKGKEITNLPKPRPNMFTNMDDSLAKAVYDSYKRHPNSKVDENGNVSYKTRDKEGNVFYEPVPPPEGNSGVAGLVEKAGRVLGDTAYLMTGGAVPAAIDAIQGENPFKEDSLPASAGAAAAGSVLNAAGSAVETALSAGQYLQEMPGSPAWLANKAGMSTPERESQRKEFSNELIRDVEDNRPQFNPKGTLQGIITPIGEAAVGMIGANKVLGAKKTAEIVTQVATKGKQFANFISKSLVRSVIGGAGMMVTSDGYNDTLAVGPTALAAEKLPGTNTSLQDVMPILKGLDGKSELEGQAILERKINVGIDAALLGVPTELIAGGAKGVLSFVYTKLIEPVHGAFSTAKKSNLIVHEFWDNIARAIGEEPGSEKAILWQNKAADILRDEKNSEILFGTPAADGSKELISPVEGIAARRVPLDTATAIDRGLAGDKSDEAAAVRKVFSETRKGVIEGGGSNTRTVLAADKPIREAEDFIDESRVYLGGDQRIEEGAKSLQDVGQRRVSAADADLEATQARLASERESVPDFLRSDIGNTIKKTEGQLDSATFRERNAATAKIRDTVTAGAKTMTDQKDQLYTDFGKSNIEAPDIESLDEALVGVGYGEETSFLPQVLQDDLEAAGTNLGILYNDVAPKINRLINKAVGEGESVPKGLQELYDNIKKVQPSILRKQAAEYSKLPTKTPEQQAVIDASLDLDSADAYERLHRNVVKKGAVKDIVNTMKSPDDITAKDTAGGIIKNTLTADQPDRVGHLIETLSRSEFGGSPKLVLDWIKGSISDEVRADILKSGVGAIDQTKLTSLFTKYRQTIENFPELTKELDTLQSNLIKNKNNIKVLEEEVLSKKGSAEAIKDEVYGRVLSDFFSKEGIPNPRGYESFVDLITGKQVTGSLRQGKLDEVLNHGEGIPEVKDALQSAYLRYLNNSEIFTSAPGSSNKRALSSSRVNDLLRGENNLLEIGRKIFTGERAPMMDFLERVLDPALDVTVSRKGATFKGAADPTSIKKAKEAVSRMVTAAVGPLTRGGSRANSTASLIIEFFNGDDKAVRIGDEMMSGASAFLKLHDRFMKQGASNENMRDWFKVLVNARVYNDSDWNQYEKEFIDANKDTQMKDAFSK